MPSLRIFPFALSVVFFLSLNGLQAQPEPDFGKVQRRITDIHKEFSQGVFRVFAAHRVYDEKGDLQTTLKVGTGFFISKEGHILTNASTVMNSNRAWFRFQGVDYAAELIGTEPSTNLALLKATNLPEDFSFFIPDGNQWLPDIGTMSLMISCPFDFDPSPSFTMVAGAETRFAQKEFATTYLRINASINPGEGGAPLVDLNGRFLGVLVVSVPEAQCGYVLPARAVLRIRDDLLFAGKFIHGWVGIEIGERSTIRDGKQIFLTDVHEASPAAAAGLQAGDILMKVGDFPINEVSDLRNAMFFARAGQFLDIRVMRNGLEEDFTVKVKERPHGGVSSSDTELQGEPEVEGIPVNAGADDAETPS